MSIQASGYSKFVEFFIRKGAHFGTYFLLGGSWFIGLVPRIKGLFLTAVVSWLAATGYAGLDEFHQMITGGRTPLFQDVMLDAMGALTAIVICLVVHGLKKNKKEDANLEELRLFVRKMDKRGSFLVALVPN